MKMTDQDKLENLLAQARKTRSTLPEDLAVRIETDAEAVRLRRLAAKNRPTSRSWRAAFDGIGGWRALGGLVAASAAGVWIGFSAPAFLPDPADFILGQETTYLVAELNLDDELLEDAE